MYCLGLSNWMELQLFTEVRMSGEERVMEDKQGHSN